MKNIVRIIGVLVLGFCLVGAVSAAFTLPGTESYLGYIGNIDLPLAKNSGGAISTNGTDWISLSGASNTDMVDNTGDQLDPPSLATPVVVTTHWYKFALDAPGQLLDFIELGANADLVVSFFHETATFGGPAFETIIRNDPHDFQLTSASVFDDGFWWMRIVGTAAFGTDTSYTVRLSKVPVPLPPAILLFGSAIAGFGVMGRKRRQRLVS